MFTNGSTLYAGFERVLEQLLLCFPNTDLFAVVDFMGEPERGFLAGTGSADIVGGAAETDRTMMPSPQRSTGSKRSVHKLPPTPAG